MRRVLLIILMCLPGLAFAGKTYEYRLPNGLKLIVREDHRAPVVVSSIWYKVGGSYEHDGITGISHMLEHMMFKGTKRYGPGGLIKIISQNGGRQNAMTSADFTMYYQRLSADKLSISFQLEADRMQNLLLQKALFTKEHQVVMEERRMRVDDSPQSLTWERFNAAAFVNNPYHHPVVGWMTDVKHLSLKDVKKWYDTWYAPNNTIVVVVGDVKPAYVFDLAKKYFGPLKAVEVPQLKPRNEVSSLGEREVTMNVPAKLPWLVIGYNVPVLKTAKQQWKSYALDVLVGILSAGDSARLSKNLIREQQVAVSASAQYELYSLHSNLLALEGVPAANHSIKDLRQAFLKEIKQLQTTLVSTEELQRVKAQVIAQNVYQKDSMMRQAFDIGRPEATGLSWRDSGAFVSRIKTVTPEQIRDVAREFLISKQLTFAVLKPKPIPTTTPASSSQVARGVKDE